MKPKDSEQKKPLIVFPHGGPHSANTEMYMLESLFFVRNGFAVLFINYRGSLGESSEHYQFAASC